MGEKNTGWGQLGAPELAELQAFLEANPEYWRIVMESDPPAGAAHEIFGDRPPAQWPSTQTHQLLARDEGGAIAGIATCVEGLFVPAVWHLGLFIVATRWHGSGRSMELYASLEALMRASGAEWVRLGVVIGNTRAERFWEKTGFHEVRRRYDVELDPVVRDLRVMVKPLAGGTIAEYLSLVARDRPD